MVFKIEPDSHEPAGLGQPLPGDHNAIPAGIPRPASQLEQLNVRPQRNRVLHWSAFALSLISLGLLAVWVFARLGPLSALWIWLDVALGVLFAVELFTRSGFRWSGVKYLQTHFFDFVAVIPALLLVNHGFFLESFWVWLVLAARAVRVIDRFLGDGFFRRLVLAVVEGFEEEITDRVLDRIIARVQSDLDQAQFSRGVAEALKRHKNGVLLSIRSATPRTGALPRVAHLVRLDAALERAEERAFDAIVEIVGSEEIDRTVRDVVNTTFSRIRNELGRKSWLEKIRFRL